ncbi:MAG TPA: TIGR03435 family protein [Terriglobia bacterium]|jgi:hypothetical protein
MLLQLNNGSIIVTAAKQGNGHLYVRTKDVTVSVVGTVFLVNAEEIGSRIAVIQGEVQVSQGTKSDKLRPGEQLSTNPLMPSIPASEELSWSRNAIAHLALLQQSIAIPAAASSSAAQERLEFEVVSIRAPSYPRVPRFACRGTDGTFEPRNSLFWTASAFTEVGYKDQVREGPMTVPVGRCIGQPDFPSLVSAAYDVPRYDISGGPQWAQGVRVSGMIQRFSIEAKAEDVTSATKEKLRQMLQSMLADRFKLKFHWEPKESSGICTSISRPMNATPMRLNRSVCS